MIYSSRTIDRTLFILIVFGTIRALLVKKKSQASIINEKLNKSIFLILDLKKKDHNGSLTRDSKITILSQLTVRLRRKIV